MDPSPADDRDAHTAALEAEIVRLRTELEGLRARHEELLAALARRDFERPPHYQ